LCFRHYFSSSAPASADDDQRTVNNGELIMDNSTP
jgi:hypothetical protein